MTLGFANSPVPYDEKHTATETKTISQRKSIEFEVNYLQTVARDIARQFILHARVQFYDPQWFIEGALHIMPVPGGSNATDDISASL
jgi:hypothetical protein